MVVNNVIISTLLYKRINEYKKIYNYAYLLPRIASMKM